MDTKQSELSSMSVEPGRLTAEDWTQWQNQVVDGVFPLRRLLGASNHSAVFLTEYPAKNLADAAIKFVPADATQAEVQLAQWRAVAALSHPNLVRLFEVGRYQTGGRDFLFVVMEHAEQTLAQILAHRPLSSDEVREILPPTLDALGFLHRNQLLHGRLQPSNFLAVDDQLKLASDTVRPAGSSASGNVRASSYDPPELSERGWSTAGDVWGFGMTLVEALTQRTIAAPGEPYETGSLPPTFPAPFAGIVRRCLSLTPEDRPTVIELEAPYKPASQTQPAAPSISEAPSGAPPKVSSEVPSAAPSDPLSELSLLDSESPSAVPAPRKFLKRDLLLPAIAVAVLIALFVWIGRDYSGPSPFPVQFGDTPASSPVAPSPAVPSAAAPSPAEPSTEAPSPETPPATPSPVETPDPALSTPVPPAPDQASVPPATTTSSVVLHEVIPDVPQNIRERMKGRIDVTVRVLVDPSGNVIGTLLEGPGRSKYFARLADKTAAEWKFVPTDKQGSRVWLLRFTFSRDGTTVLTTSV